MKHAQQNRRKAKAGTPEYTEARQRMIEAAIELLAEQGLVGDEHLEIARQSGVVARTGELGRVAKRLDADYYVPGKTRGEVAIEFIETWKAAGIPNPDILKIMTINGYKVSQTENTRGPIKPGFFADLIAVPGNPLQSIDALRDVQFVMKDGVVFKRNGVMTPEKFFHGGPVNGWNIR